MVWWRWCGGGVVVMVWLQHTAADKYTGCPISIHTGGFKHCIFLHFRCISDAIE